MSNELIARAHVALLSRKQEGASAVEYGLILGLIAVVIVAALTLMGTELDQTYDCIVSKLGGGGACA